VRSFYEIESFLPDCPDLNKDSVDWTLLQLDLSPERACPKSASCTAGRLEIRTIRPDDKPAITSYASIMGCAKKELMARIENAPSDLHRCDIYKTNGTGESGLYHTMKMEHCSTYETVCSHSDFCLSPKESEIRDLKNNSKLTETRYALIIGCVVVGIIFLLGWAVAKFYSFGPRTRISDLPKFPDPVDDEDTDSVVPVSTKSAVVRKGSLSQSEILDGGPSVIKSGF
jgi:hypothetical protein